MAVGQPVRGHDVASPLQGIGRAYPRRLRTNPELEVLGSVVIAYAVAVMNCLAWKQIATQRPLKNENVLEHVAVLPGARMRPQEHHEVASLVTGPASTPIPVGRLCLAVAGRACTRSGLLHAATGTQVA